MNTCGTCKHFGPLYDLLDGEHGFHECLLLKHLNDHLGHFRDRVLGDDKAGVVDGSGYHAAFCVTDEFGCNQWEAKK